MFVLGIFARWIEKTRNLAAGYLQVILISILLSLVMGLRSFSVGTDTSHYVDAFNQFRFIPLASWHQTHYEFLYVVFNKLVLLLSGDARCMILLESSITVALFGRFFYKNSPDPLLSFGVYYLCFFYLSAFNISRFWLAMAIALFGYDLARAGRLVPSLCWAVIGGLIHTSVVLIAAIYIIISNLSIKNDSTILLVLFGGVALSFFSGHFLGLLAALFPRYSVYIDSDLGVSSGILFPLILSCMVIGSLLIIEIEEDTSEMGDVRLLSLVVVLGVMLLLMGGKVDIAARGAQLFTIFLTLLIPRVACISRYGNIYALSCIACLALYCINLLLSNSGEIIPYMLL